jgi:hypothetical protein
MTRDGTVAPRVADSADIADPIRARGTRTAVKGAPAGARRRRRAALGRRESGKAASPAAATAANNAIQLVFTLVFTRLLGASGHETPAALISAFVVLMVAGRFVQVAAARAAALDRLARPDGLRATLRAWTRRLLVVLVAVAAASALLREPLAALVGVDEAPWAAAAIPPTGVLWVLLSFQRRALHGLPHAAPDLAVQYLGALGETRFLWVLGVLAPTEPVVVSAGDDGVVAVAAVALGAPCAAAAGVVGLGLRTRAVELPVAPAR